MKKKYKNIMFNGLQFNNVFNALVDEESYSESLIGAVEIIEERIPGRDLPYFYGKQKSPLEFDVTFAFDTPLLKSEIRAYIREFLTPDGYAELVMWNDEGESTPIYKVIFTGEPTLEYFAASDNMYNGFFSLHARCNAPYGFTRGFIDANEENSKIEISNLDSDFPSSDYTMTIINPTKDTIENAEVNISGEIISFSKIYAGETIIVRGRLKRMVSNHNGELALYDRWNKVIPVIYPGEQLLTRSKDIRVTINYELPKIM